MPNNGDGGKFNRGHRFININNFLDNFPGSEVDRQCVCIRCPTESKYNRQHETCTEEGFYKIPVRVDGNNIFKGWHG
jgi:hypothetical protein